MRLAYLKEAGVDLITIGQYLAPSKNHLAVDRFPEPERYDEWAETAMQLGFLAWPADRLFARHTKPDSWFARRRTRTTTKRCSEPMFGLHHPIHPNRHHLRRTSPEVNQ